MYISMMSAVFTEVNLPRLSWQAGYIRIDGSVPSSERIQLVHKFQSDPDTRVAILSIQAAGQVLQIHIKTQTVTQLFREYQNTAITEAYISDKNKENEKCCSIFTISKLK